jgi:dihydroxyacetone synthase
LDGFDKAKKLTGKPVLLNIRTIIGFSSRKANTGPAHGAALGDEEVAYVKQQLGFDPDAKFRIPSKVYDYFSGLKEKGAKAEEEWNESMKLYASKYPQEYKELEMRRSGRFAEAGWQELLPSKDRLPQAAQPTRKSSGIAVQAFAPHHKSFIAGSADLLESTFVNFEGQVEFQNVSATVSPSVSLSLAWAHGISPFLAWGVREQPASGLGDYSGRQVRYGIREFAMVGLGNGMSAYCKGMFIP